MRITKMTLCICAALGSSGTIAQTSNEQMHTHSHAIMPMPTTTLKIHILHIRSPMKRNIIAISTADSGIRPHKWILSGW